jgi:hypothetical protein
MHMLVKSTRGGGSCIWCFPVTSHLIVLVNCMRVILMTNFNNILCLQLHMWFVGLPTPSQ